MSVQRIPVLVTRTQIVSTVKVRTAATVGKDLTEMEKFVKVEHSFRSQKLTIRILIHVCTLLYVKS